MGLRVVDQVRDRLDGLDLDFALRSPQEGQYLGDVGRVAHFAQCAHDHRVRIGVLTEQALELWQSFRTSESASSVALIR